jgi:transcriptional regulator with XRE-family HTH domain
MPRDPDNRSAVLTGHALRNANLRMRSLSRAVEAPPLARALVTFRAGVLGMTRIEFARRSGIGRGTLRDLELGLHRPVRRTLQRFVDFCRQAGVAGGDLEELRRLYTGQGDGLGPLIARLQLLAGSSVELARRVGISAATLWEYRRGNYPLPLAMLRALCQAVGEPCAPAEKLWHETERQRLLGRGYPPALAAFWALCARGGYAEKHLSGLGLNMAALRRLRYMELPAWKDVSGVARALCRSEEERLDLERLWLRTEPGRRQPADGFGPLLLQMRKQKGLERREVADLFGVGGKKPAQVIQAIEEDGCYSARAYPAGLAALLAGNTEQQVRLLELWMERRKRFHRRRRPETRTDFRLARELYGFEHGDMEAVLGYAPLDYQKIERGVAPLSEAGHGRILAAIHQAGRRRIEALLRKKDARDAERAAWRFPKSVPTLVAHLAEREGGIVPLSRCLCRAGVKGFWPDRLRAIARGQEVPAWPLLERVGRACEVPDLSEVKRHWREQYRARLHANNRSPLGVELRLLVAEVAESVRGFSAMLGVNPSVLVRALQQADRDKPLKWFHVERILRAAGLEAGNRRWEQIHAWWYTTADRR